MRISARSVIGGLCLIGSIACADSVGTDDYDGDVEIVTSLERGDSISVSLKNVGADTIYFLWGRLQHRGEDGEWDGFDIRNGIGFIDIMPVPVPAVTPENMSSIYDQFSWGRVLPRYHRPASTGSTSCYSRTDSAIDACPMNSGFQMLSVSSGPD